MNRRVPNGTHGGVRGRELITPSYSIIFGKDVNIVARKKTKRLRYEDRVIIERMSKAGKKVADIANEIGVHRDTIYKEFTRCGATKETYSAEKAQREI